MRFNQILRKNFLLVFLLLLLTAMSWSSETAAGELQLSWTDNATNEDGFKIERKTGTTGTYAQITTVGANVTSYTDSSLVDGATYCYHVRAYNSGGNSSYTPEVCGAARSTVPPSGTIIIGENTSLPEGDNGNGNLLVAQQAILSQTATIQSLSFYVTTAAGNLRLGIYDATGPSGAPGAKKAETNSFAPVTGWNTQNVITPVSLPAGIYWLAYFPSDNSLAFVKNSDASSSGRFYSLAYGTLPSIFSTSSNTTTSHWSFYATLNTGGAIPSLTVAKAGTGGGTVNSSPAGINCGATCSGTFDSGTSVTLTATPAAGSIFAGWTGDADCSDGSVTMNASKSCTATFNLQTFGLSVTKAGTGNGTVSSSPAGINCGSTCSRTFNSGTIVQLTASAAAGSIFAGWSGTGCSSTGSVTMDANKTCTATFNVQPVTTFTLTVTKTGTGTGTVTSTDGGINCGGTCSKVYNSGTSVTLNATPAAGSIFAGWTGDADCTDGSVTINASKSCTATFNLQPPQTFTLSVGKAGTGSGTVTATGVNCGADCSEVLPSGNVQLTAAASAGSIFSGWSGGGCSGTTATCTVNLTANTTVTANFQPQNNTNQLATRIGIFRPSTGQWFLDRNGNGMLDDCTIDMCVPLYGQDGMLPVVGDWVVKGKSNIGTFDPATGSWHLDHGSFTWDACGTDSATCISSFGQTGDLPVVKESNNSDQIMIGIYRSTRPSKPSRWRIDANGDAKLGRCTTDSCFDFGVSGDLPVVGDWNGAGADKIGVFRPSLGQWFLDLNGNGKWDGSPNDTILGPFGSVGDRPVVGDWDGTEKVKIGVFRPSTGEWFLDLNGNGKLDNCSVDACLGPFGQAGDLPVVGKWQ